MSVDPSYKKHQEDVLSGQRRRERVSPLPPRLSSRRDPLTSGAPGLARSFLGQADHNPR